jgi:H+/Cl- antiporter ClcA
MSHEGFILVVRGAVVLSLILVAAVVRTFIGASNRRGGVMLAGMLGGMALGMAFSYLIPSLKMQESAVFAVCGMLLGWGVAWFFAKQIPRESN